MSKIVKNTTGSAVTVNDVGVTIPALSQYTIPPQDYLLWAASSNAVTYIGDTSLVVNDGSIDLSISDGVNLIKGIYPTPIDISSPFIVNLAMPTAGVEYDYAFPALMKQFEIKARSSSRLQLAFVSGESGTNFATCYPGAMYKEWSVRRNAVLTLYAQASKDNETLEIVYWT